MIRASDKQITEVLQNESWDLEAVVGELLDLREQVKTKDEKIVYLETEIDEMNGN